jgi:hypothetical protein
MIRITVKAHKLKDRRFDNWHSEIEGRWRIADLRADAGYNNDWISLFFTSCFRIASPAA